MAAYRFVSTWRLAAPVDAVFEALARPDAWHERWRWFARTEVLTEGGAHGVGGRLRCVVHSPLPYSLAFDIERVAAEPPWSLAERVVGDLEGAGRWELAEGDGVTVVSHIWTVRTTKAWMNALAPVARPGFVWAHRVVMRDGARALSQGLGVALRTADSRVEPGDRAQRCARVLTGVAVGLAVWRARRCRRSG